MRLLLVFAHVPARQPDTFPVKTPDPMDEVRLLAKQALASQLGKYGVLTADNRSAPHAKVSSQSK